VALQDAAATQEDLYPHDRGPKILFPYLLTVIERRQEGKRERKLEDKKITGSFSPTVVWGM
jgi:hypothetical protein